VVDAVDAVLEVLDVEAVLEVLLVVDAVLDVEEVLAVLEVVEVVLVDVLVELDVLVDVEVLEVVVISHSVSSYASTLKLTSVSSAMAVMITKYALLASRIHSAPSLACPPIWLAPIDPPGTSAELTSVPLSDEVGP
jgi:hypothetical protein